MDIFKKLGKGKELKIWLSGKRGEGEYMHWRTNGQIAIHSFWEDGKLDGEFKFWNSSGQIIEHSFWKAARRHGECKFWHHDGQIIEHSFWKNGKREKYLWAVKRDIVIDIFTKLGKEWLEIWLTGKEEAGEVRSWYSNGQIAHKAIWESKKPNGEVIWWWTNGKIKTKSVYEYGKNMSTKYWNEKRKLL